MEREKLLKYRGLAPIRFLNDFNAGLLTATEYRLIRAINKSDAWDKIDDQIADAEQAEPGVMPKGPTPEEPSHAPLRTIELKTDVKFDKNFFTVPNEVVDILAPLQTPVEEVVYRRLFRMSYGWRRNFCRASIPFIMKTSMIKSENTVRKALRGLVDKGHIAEYVNENGRVDTNNEGTLYIVFLPSEVDGLPQWGAKVNGDINVNVGIENKGLQDLRVQNMHPQSKTIAITTSTIRGANIEGVKYDGDAKFKGANIEPTDLQNLKAQNLTPPAERLMNAESTSRGANLEGANIKPIKNNIKDNFKNTLSLCDIIFNFYRGIGQKKVTKAKREKAEKCIEELLNEEFNLEDIQFAVQWTLENSKEDIYDFAIIKHTISQAIVDKEKREAEKARKLEREKMVLKDQESERRNEEEIAKLRAHKEELSKEERTELRKKAMDEIEKMEGVKKEFITPILIEAKENEMLKAKLEDNR